MFTKDRIKADSVVKETGYKTRYVYTVSIALVLLIVNQVYVQYTLDKTEVFAQTTNLAGRQRMLSQKIAQLVISSSGSNSDAIRIYLDEFIEVHKELKRETFNLDVNVPKKGVAMLTRLDPYITSIQSTLAQNNLLIEQEHELISMLEMLLSINDDVVEVIVNEHNRRIRLVRLLEIVITTITLIVVLFEIYFVFIPTFRRLVQSRSLYVKISVELRDSLRLIHLFAHDLRSPLQSILTKTEVLKLREENIETKRELNGISETIKGIDDVIKVMLRRGGGDQRPVDRFYLCDVLNEVKRDLSEDFSEVVCFAFPECSTQVLGNKIEVRLLFQNLISNAIKYRDTVRPLEIIVETRQLEGAVEVSVSDNGIGIPESKLKNIFDYEYRAIENDSNRSGKGIGLYHCMEIVRLNGGEIRVQSELNKGSTFIFTLPC